MTSNHTPARATAFRKKPVVVEARQFNNDESSYAVLHWINAARGLDAFALWHNDKLIVPTLEGDITASPGDWIIRGVAGEFYPCKPEIFAATYEPAALAAGTAGAPTPLAAEPFAYFYSDAPSPTEVNPLVHSTLFVLARDRAPYRGETPLYAAPLQPAAAPELQAVRAKLIHETLDDDFVIGPAFAAAPEDAAPETITLQEAWDAAGGNPGIPATREGLLYALRSMDEAIDAADEVLASSRAQQGAPVAMRVIGAVGKAIEEAIAGATAPLSNAARQIPDREQWDAGYVEGVKACATVVQWAMSGAMRAGTKDEA